MGYSVQRNTTAVKNDPTDCDGFGLFVFDVLLHSRGRFSKSRRRIHLYFQRITSAVVFDLKAKKLMDGL
jgi:hypothetical protein